MSHLDACECLICEHNRAVRRREAIDGLVFYGTMPKQLPKTLPASVVYTKVGVRWPRPDETMKLGADERYRDSKQRVMSLGHGWKATDLDWSKIPIQEPLENPGSQALALVAQNAYDRLSSIQIEITIDTAVPVCTECRAPATHGRFCVYCHNSLRGPFTEPGMYAHESELARRFADKSVSMASYKNPAATHRMALMDRNERLPVTATARELAKPHPWECDE